MKHPTLSRPTTLRRCHGDGPSVARGQPRRHPSSTDTNPAAKLPCRMCETTLVLREANGGYEDIFWNIQIVRTFSLNVLAIARKSPETLPRLFEQEDRRNNNAIRNSRPHLAVAHGITKHEHHEVRRRRPLRTHRQCFCCREPSRLCNTERLYEVSGFLRRVRRGRL